MTDGAPREVRLPRLPGGAVVWLVAAGVVGLVLLTVVTASSPVNLVSQPAPGSPPGVSSTVPPATLTASDTAGPSVPPLFNPNDLPTIPLVLIALIQLVVAVAVGWILALMARYAWRNAPRMSSRVVDRLLLTPLPALPDELVETAEARLALLQEGSPRNAIVACWADLEDAASAAGLPRLPHETAAEYTIRVLHTWDVAPDAMGGLAELYREARYSRHPLTEEHRHRAVGRLTVIHDDLRRVAATAAAALEEAGAATGGTPRVPG